MSIARFINRAWSGLVDWTRTSAATFVIVMLIVTIVLATLILTNRQ